MRWPSHENELQPRSQDEKKLQSIFLPGWYDWILLRQSASFSPAFRLEGFDVSPHNTEEETGKEPITRKSSGRKGHLNGFRGVSFESFLHFPNLLVLDLSHTSVDCKNALGLLPSMACARNIRKLGLEGTNAGGDIEFITHCKQLQEINFKGCKSIEGIFTGALIRMISDMRTTHGKGCVNLTGCGKFVLAGDLSDVGDLACMDLSDIPSLHVGSERAADFLCEFGGKLAQGWFAAYVIERYKETRSQLVEIKNVPLESSGSIDILEYLGTNLEVLDLSSYGKFFFRIVRTAGYAAPAHPLPRPLQLSL